MGVRWPLDLFAGVCPGADLSRVIPGPGVARLGAWEFLAPHVPSGQVHHIQLLGRPLSGKLTPRGPLPPRG